jgi:hypothetical protein
LCDRPGQRVGVERLPERGGAEFALKADGFVISGAEQEIQVLPQAPCQANRLRSGEPRHRQIDHHKITGIAAFEVGQGSC